MPGCRSSCAPAAGDTVADRAGLERLVARLRPIVATPAPVAVGAGLAARLLAEWRRPERTGGPTRRPRRTPGRPVRPRAGGWRSLFDLAGAGSLPVAPVMLRQHRPEPEDPAEAPGVEHLRLVVELSRLGRVAIDLRVDARTLATSLTSAGPLDAGLRAGIGEVYAAAVELAGRTGSLAFRVAPAAAIPGPPVRPVDDLTV
ncbi:MAG: hypothetical protein R3D28_24835 [Geminicoccaceae bacterium]